MLKGISPCLSPELLKVLAEMGHGDEMVLADAHFPGHSVNSHTLRADGVSVVRAGGANSISAAPTVDGSVPTSVGGAGLPGAPSPGTVPGASAAVPVPESVAGSFTGNESRSCDGGGVRVPGSSYR